MNNNETLEVDISRIGSDLIVEAYNLYTLDIEVSLLNPTIEIEVYKSNEELDIYTSILDSNIQVEIYNVINNVDIIACKATDDLLIICELIIDEEDDIYEIFKASDGDFILKDDIIFKVLKDGL